MLGGLCGLKNFTSVFQVLAEASHAGGEKEKKKCLRNTKRGYCQTGELPKWVKGKRLKWFSQSKGAIREKEKAFVLKMTVKKFNRIF